MAKDSKTGLYYYGARYYDPRTSIFLSTDPLMEKYPNVNPYVYCVQNPVVLVDPDGKDPTPFEAALMASDVYSNTGNLAGGWQQSAMYGFNLNVEETGLKGTMYERIKEDGVTEYAFVFAGTEEIEKDGLNDLTQVVGFSDQYHRAGLVAEQMEQYIGDQQLTFVGHSLGGGLANYASLRTGRSSVTFNPAWISNATKKKRKNNKLKKGNYRRNYIHESDPLNRIQVLGGRAVGIEPTGEQYIVNGGLFSNIITGHLIGTMISRMQSNKQNTVHSGNRDDKIIHISPRDF
ncbi:RHS repeat-associated core domain-containing protein [Flavobacterium rivuli]|nr:RHS repeat-associated core domain-containing protein [Flavobacterium rivuli]